MGARCCRWEKLREAHGFHHGAAHRVTWPAGIYIIGDVAHLVPDYARHHGAILTGVASRGSEPSAQGMQVYCGRPTPRPGIMDAYCLAVATEPF